MKPKSKNLFPGLYLGGLDDCRRRKRRVSLDIKISDRELAFVLHRQAKAVGRTVESYCKDAILSVLESDEEYNRDRINEETGFVIARGEGDAEPGISVLRR